MSKEWILNIATNRWGLNKKRSVGPVSEWIRQEAPKDINQWQNAYYQKLSQFLQSKNINISPSEYLTQLGQKLYVKITEVLQAEISEITEEDCIDYIHNLVINRTFDGYQTEITTVYEKLQQILGVEIRPAPDEWDRLYNVDFFIQVNDKYIGLQIKPITYNQTPQVHKWVDWMRETHRRFTEKFGGKVFIIFSTKQNKQKVIVNTAVIDQIKAEIVRLQN